MTRLTESTWTLSARHVLPTRTVMQDVLHRHREAAQFEQRLGESSIQSLLQDMGEGRIERDPGMDLDSLLALTRSRLRSKPQAAKSAASRMTRAKLDEATPLDELLDLARVTGRKALERESLRNRSQALLDKLGKAEPETRGAIRSFLSPPPTEATGRKTVG